MGRGGGGGGKTNVPNLTDHSHEKIYRLVLTPHMERKRKREREREREREQMKMLFLNCKDFCA